MSKFEESRIQEAIVKRFNEANNPEAKNYDEALEMELGLNCEIIVNNIRVNNDLRIILDLDTNSSGKDWNFITRTYDNANRHREIRRVEIKKIIGKPLSLSRVLISLKSKHLIISTAGYVCKRIGDSEYQNICYWDLTKETLEEQTEEAQRAINKLLKHD